MSPNAESIGTETHGFSFGRDFRPSKTIHLIRIHPTSKQRWGYCLIVYLQAREVSAATVHPTKTSLATLPVSLWEPDVETASGSLFFVQDDSA